MLVRALRGQRQRVVAYGFLLPTFVLIVAFSYFPAVRAGVTAFTHWDGFNAPSFIGFTNFVNAFKEADFRGSMAHVAIWTAIGVPLALVPSFVIAELIYRLHSERAQYIWRAVFVAPMILPPVVLILIWQNMYSFSGIINVFLKDVGLGKYGQSWIGDPHFALWALIFLGFPWVVPFNVLIFYAGLKSIPAEIVEASAVDGATRWRQLLRIEMPLTSGQWKLLFVLDIIAVTQNLLVPLLLTNGGPANATMTPVLYMYQQAINYGKYGYGMAIGTMLFVAVLVLSMINLRFLHGNQDQ